MNSNEVCVDASLAVKVVVPEPSSDKADALFQEWADENRRLIAPAFFDVEADSIIRQKTLLRKELSVEEGEAAFEKLQALPIEKMSPPGQRRRAWEIANMGSRFRHYPVGRIILLLALLCVATLLVLPLTKGNQKTLAVKTDDNLEAEITKKIDSDPHGFSSRIDSHNDLLNILRRNERAKVTRSPISKSGTSEPSQPTEAQRENSLQNRDRDSDGDRFDDPEAAANFYRQKRLPTGATELPMERYQAALDHMAKMRRYSTASNQLLPAQQPESQDTPEANLGAWTSLGPGNIGGRTRAIVIDPTNPNTMFAAAVTGGVWKSINAGATWFSTGDFMANLNVATLAMDPANPNILYAGTGEDLVSWPGNGVFKTTNGAASWTQLTATANNSSFTFVKRVVVSPSRNGQRVYAATNSGVWRSIDGGTNWTQVLTISISGGCTDLAIRTDATGQVSDYIFAACGLSAQATIYRNTNANGAGSWDAVVTEANMGRTSLAIAPSNQNTIYALSADLSGPYGRGALHAVFRSTTGGGTGSWTARVRNTDPNPMNTLLLSYCDGSGSQGLYDQTVAVDPVNENRVWIGGIDLYRSDDGGANWGWNLSNAFHVDQHTVVFHPQYDGVNNKVMLVGNDGGIFKTADATAGPLKTTPCDFTACPGCVSFTSLNVSYAATQFYHGLPYPNGTTYFGGTQDNSVVRGSDINGLNGWSVLQSPLGDGQFVAIDPTNTNTLYANGGVRTIYKSTNGGASWVSVTSGISDSSFFITPLVMDPTNSQRLWTGGSFMWRTDNSAANWSQASAALAGGGIARAIVVSSLNADKVLAGTSTGFIHRTSAGTSSTAATAWPSVQPRSGNVSGLAYDPANSNVAYATYSTFNSIASDRHVYKSIDGGATWAGIDGTAPNNLPDVPALTIVVDPTNPQRLYVGTDVGVFSSLDGGANWAVENTGFANVITEALAFNTGSLATKYLFAFTHGRGAWRVLLSNACSTITSVSSTVAGVGDTIQINGGGFLNASGVKFSNNVSATFTVSDSVISATVPAGAIGGPITISKPGCPDVQTPPVTICASPPTQLLIDNGVIGIAATAGSNAYYVNRLTPASYPALLDQVSIFIAGFQNLPTGTPITVVAGPNPGGTSNINGTSFTALATTLGATGQFNAYSLASPVQINSGDFVVGFTTAGGGNTLPAAFSSNASVGRSYFSTNGTSFTQDTSNLMIRGRVFSGTCSVAAPTPTPTPVGGLVQFAAPQFDVIESSGAVTVTVTRTGDTSTAASVGYTTTDGAATQKGDYIFAAGTLSFAAGETSKSFTVLIINDAYQEGTETLGVSLSNPVGTALGLRSTATVAIFDDDLSPPTANPIDQAGFFVREHYYDFLNRLPDADGLAFWTNEITSCGNDQACMSLKRVNVSAAYFLSIEFQQTGYLVERMYKAAYGDANGVSTLGGAHQLSVPVVRYTEFLTDSQQIGKGVVVGQTGWEQVLESNKQNFAAQFVQRSRFTNAFSTAMMPAQFVDKLFMNAGVTPSSTDRNAAIAEFGSATNTNDVAARARALRDVSENSILNQQEFNRAFVLMQFFGYLRRNPNDLPDADYSGYDFWLTKLNQFNGNFVAAEMVKAFITSIEYRNRFGP